MFTIKAVWKHSDFPSYSVYTAEKYCVGRRGDTNVTTVMIDDIREIAVGEGDRVYVMNEHGSTIDTIIA